MDVTQRAVTREVLANRVLDAVTVSGVLHAELAEAIGMEHRQLMAKLLGLVDFTSLDLAKIATHLRVGTWAFFADDEMIKYIRLVTSRIQEHVTEKIQRDLAVQLWETHILLQDLGYPGADNLLSRASAAFVNGHLGVRVMERLQSYGNVDARFRELVAPYL